MRNEQGFTAMEDMTLLLVAVFAFTVFFASVVGAYVTREKRARGEALQADADAFLEAVGADARWTAGRGMFLADALNETTAKDLLPLAAGRPFILVVRDLATDDRWSFGGGSSGDRRVAVTSANVVADGVHPARVTATVWES